MKNEELKKAGCTQGFSKMNLKELTIYITADLLFFAWWFGWPEGSPGLILYLLFLRLLTLVPPILIFAFLARKLTFNKITTKLLALSAVFFSGIIFIYCIHFFLFKGYDIGKFFSLNDATEMLVPQLFAFVITGLFLVVNHYLHQNEKAIQL
ncbi:MAG: hypothetical protein R3B47_12925 [Bacteroidia bacterium]